MLSSLLNIDDIEEKQEKQNLDLDLGCVSEKLPANNFEALDILHDADTTNSARQDVQSYVVLARKYRPTTFDNLIGQETVVQILKNAITQNRIPQAILLTGIRGIGKTTIARIIAKALNCAAYDAPTDEPCGKCEQCISIMNSHSQDVLEMDAASHTGVNDIREIIENVKYKPISGRFRVFIIDEVHMLSNSAFNALLKTLEEPPPHVKFIFATTEAHKIPLTIISRCQRFYLRRLDTQILANYYNSLLQKENFTADTEALHLISQAADGSVRDGLSMLDQAISLANGNHITEVSIISMLGANHHDVIFDLLNSIISNNAKNVIDRLDQMYISGLDVKLIIQDMLQLIHAILKMQIFALDSSKESEVDFAQKLLGESYSRDYILQIQELSKLLTNEFLNKAWVILMNGLKEVQITEQMWLVLEVTILRLFTELHNKDVESINEANDVEVVKYGDKQTKKTKFNEFKPNINENVVSSYIEEKVVEGEEHININTESNNISVKGMFDQDNYMSIDEAVHTLVRFALDNNELMLYHWFMHDIIIRELKGNSISISFNKPMQKNIVALIKQALKNLTEEDWSVTVIDEKIDNSEMLDKENDDNKKDKTLFSIIQKQKEKTKEELLQSKIVQDIISEIPDLSVSEINLKE